MTRAVIRIFTVFLFLVLFQTAVFSQDYFRIKADFTVKISNSDGTRNLTRGVVYYDKNIRELIYDISFPEKETWVSRDTSLLKIRDGKVYEKMSIPSINEFTIFHLALNSMLNDFGLKNSPFKIQKVEKKGDLTLSYWNIPEQASTLMDFVVVARNGNRLESVVIMADEQKVLSKQFFRNYTKVKAFEFPTQIVQILYDTQNRENYQLTEFKNLVVNETGNNESYKTTF
ncbi:hypothetical protein BA6E_101110 [Bacteroidales bacterium 6E]|nr:hypothetical protein BA6E_101110 [Bacteroidales bacterium 6E]